MKSRHFIYLEYIWTEYEVSNAMSTSISNAGEYSAPTLSALSNCEGEAPCEVHNCLPPGWKKE